MGAKDISTQIYRLYICFFSLSCVVHIWIKGAHQANSYVKYSVDWYEADLSRLGSDLPTPCIKWTKEAGKGEKFHFLSWGEPGSGAWVSDNQLKENIFDLDTEALIPESKCNTRKQKDKRSRRQDLFSHFSNEILDNV